MTTDKSLDRRWERAVDAFRQGDKAGALYMFKALARDGQKAAYREIGNILEFGGAGVPRNIEEAVRWYRKALDIANDGYACIGLARIYYYGKLGKPEYDKALWYLELIEEKDFPLANLLFAKLYLNGRGVERSRKKASDYLTRAAQQGNVSAKRELGLLAIKEGKIFHGVGLIAATFYEAFRIASENFYDERLRRI